MAEIHEQFIALPGQRAGAGGYLAEPVDDAPHGGVIVVQEWWGLSDYLKDVTRRLAGEGFVALAPDLYHGKLATEPEEAGRLMAALTVEDGVADLLAAVSHLQSMPRVQPKKLGVVGFCMGGRFALELAAHSTELAAVAPFYPSPAEEVIPKLNRVSAPMFVAFGDRDPRIPPDVMERFQAEVRRLGMTAEIQVYHEAAHAFHNNTSPSYKPDAAKDAWARALQLFRRELRSN